MKREDEKTSKGITLIALIITIIVMLILAAVAISMLFGENGIINRASNAGNTWKEAEDNEQDALGTIQNTWDDLVSEKKEPALLIDVAEIGDYVSYSKTYTNVGNLTIGSVLEGTGTNWRVFSKDEVAGTIKIIPAGTPMFEDELENIGNLLDTSVATGIANIELADIQEMCSQTGISIEQHSSYSYYIMSDLNNLLYNGTIIRTNTTATDSYGQSGKMYLYSGSSFLVLEYYTGAGDANKTYGIRPLVTLKTGVMTNKGNGSNSTPYNMYMSD